MIRFSNRDGIVIETVLFEFKIPRYLFDCREGRKVRGNCMNLSSKSLHIYFFKSRFKSRWLRVRVEISSEFYKNSESF